MSRSASRANCSTRNNGPRGPAPAVYNVTREDHELGIFGQRGVEDFCGRRVGGFEKEVAQMVGHLGHAHQRLIQMEVAGMDETKRPSRHGRLRTRCPGRRPNSRRRRGIHTIAQCNRDPQKVLRRFGAFGEKMGSLAGKQSCCDRTPATLTHLGGGLYTAMFRELRNRASWGYRR